MNAQHLAALFATQFPTPSQAADYLTRRAIVLADLGFTKRAGLYLAGAFFLLTSTERKTS